MMTAKNRPAAFRNAAWMVLMLSALWLFPPRATAGELSEVPAALSPGFNLPDLAGRQRSLDEFAGRVVLVTFWASWCSPCIEEMPSIQRLAAAMADTPFAVIGVNVAEGERRVRAAVTRLGIEFPILLDKDSTTFRDWGADVLPTAYILDASGRIRYMARGPVEWDRIQIVETLQQLAVEQQPSHEQSGPGSSVSRLPGGRDKHPGRP